MKTHFSLIAVAIIVVASLGFILEDDIDSQINAKPADSAPDDYHNATINFNVDLPGGEPAAGFEVEVRSSKYSSNKDSGTTDSAGLLKLGVNFMTLGLSEIRIKDLNATSVYFEKIEIWPDEDIDKDITVNEPLEFFNHIHGIVRNSSNDSPIPDVVVSISGEDINGNAVSVSNTTGSSGMYDLYIPNSTSSYRISFMTTLEYYSNTFYLFLEEDVNDYQRDFYLKPYLQLSQPAHIRIKDTTSGEYQTRGTLSVSGVIDQLDDITLYQTIYSADSDTGWFNTSLDRGEHYANFQPSYLTKDPYVYVNNYFYVNDTEVFHEIPVTLPEYIEFEVEIWNSTSPLQNAYASWREEIDNVVIGCYDYSHTNGKAYLKVPIDRVFDIQITLAGYHTKWIEVDPFGSSSLIEINVTIERIPPTEVSRANVTIQVVDDVTGIGIPYAGVRLLKIAENVGHGNSYQTNVTGYVKKTIDLTSGDHVFIRFVFSSDNYLGSGEVEVINIQEGEEKEILIRTKRLKMEEPYIRTHFYVKDKTGTPIPGLKLQVSMIGDVDVVYSDVLTDSTGRAELIGPPGEYSFGIYDSIRHRRNHWSIKNQKFEVKDPGLIGVITAYSSFPLDTYWGFVKDAHTSDIIGNVRVESNSVEKLDLTRNGGPPTELNEVSLFYMSSGTDIGGYFRTKGTGTIKLNLNKIGYFNRKVEVQSGTRATQIEDIFMEPLTEPDLWVNGTLVNEVGEPINGFVYVYDEDHDHHQLNREDVNGTGEFSLELYAGNFSFYFTNNTLFDTVYMAVGPDGIEDLELMLIPTSEIAGVVEDWSGAPLSGVNITLIDPNINEPGSWILTDEFGEFSFEVIAGNYYLTIGESELFDAYNGTTFETDGWVDKFFEITLENRTTADIMGDVMGEAGPLVAGVPGAIVILMMDGDEVHSATADTGGYFEFIDVDHGTNYSIEAIPPLEWQPVIGSESGYLMNSTMNITISGVSIEIDIMLPFMEYLPDHWLEFVGHQPEGENVSLDEDIVVKFNRAVNISTFMEAIQIEPMIEVNFSLNIDGDAVIMTHDPFEPNTTYEIIIAGSVFSVDGWPLMDYEGMSWNFTTSDRMSSWKITSVDIDVDDGKNVTFVVNGVDDMSLYVVIDGLGSYQVTHSGIPGRYTLTIDGEDLDWSYMYFFHFSDEDDGEDLAIGFSGNFTTPSEPGSEWGLIDSTVIGENDGSISVEARGWVPDHLVWINIQEVGWFELMDYRGGIYRVTIEAGDLDWSTTYDYYYSDREGGPDLAPDLAGSVTTIDNPEPDDDDDDDTTIIDDDDTGTSGVGKAMVWTLSCCGIVLLLIFIILIVMLVARRRSKKEGFDEE
jgi:Big-like domain-containing protein